MRTYCILPDNVPRIYLPEDEVVYLSVLEKPETFLNSVCKVLRNLSLVQREEGVLILRGPVCLSLDFHQRLNVLRNVNPHVHLFILGYRTLNVDIWTFNETQLILHDLKISHPDTIKDILGFWIQGPQIQRLLDKFDHPPDKLTGLKSWDLITRLPHLIVRPPLILDDCQCSDQSSDQVSVRVIG